MNVTDEMVDRAAKEIAFRLGHNTTDRYVMQTARAALTAALGDVEPLEDVLRESVHHMTVHQYDKGWIVTVTLHGGNVASSQRLTGLDAAIRAAVAAAKGEGK